MGMFDFVNFETTCPTCGAILNDFQTKDTSCIMEQVELNDVCNFYTMCKNCHSWIEYNRSDSVDLLGLYESILNKIVAASGNMSSELYSEVCLAINTKKDIINKFKCSVVKPKGETLNEEKVETD